MPFLRAAAHHAGLHIIGAAGLAPVWPRVYISALYRRHRALLYETKVTSGIYTDMCGFLRVVTCSIYRSCSGKGSVAEGMMRVK